MMSLMQSIPMQTRTWSKCSKRRTSNSPTTKSSASKTSLPMFVHHSGNRPNSYVLVFPTASADLILSPLQVATRMHKQFQDDRYLYWTVISTVLQVCVHNSWLPIGTDRVFRQKNMAHPSSSVSCFTNLHTVLLSRHPHPHM